MIKLKYPYPYIEQHEAQAIIIFCMDFRFREATLEFVKNEVGIKDWDIIGLAGAAKNLANPDTECNRKVALKQIELSVKLHKIKKIIIINHADCGAYGGRKAFKSDEEEKNTHFKDLKISRELLKRYFSNQEVLLYYADLAENWIKFERIE